MPSAALADLVYERATHSIHNCNGVILGLRAVDQEPLARMVRSVQMDASFARDACRQVLEDRQASIHRSVKRDLDLLTYLGGPEAASIALRIARTIDLH